MPCIFDGGLELGDFARVQQQLARAAGRVVVDVALRVFGDVRVVQDGRAVFDAHKGVGQLGQALAQGLHFRPAQHDARLQALAHVVKVEGLGVADFA